MNRRASLTRGPLRALFLALCLSLLGLLGCMSQDKRAQSDEEPAQDHYEVKTIGEITAVGNAEPIPVGGVGLVDGLDGTGGEAIDEDYRRLFEDQLRKRGVKNIKRLLNSPETALVIVSALLPAGSHKGEVFDVEVALTPRSKATSLRGGYLRECLLFNYDVRNYKGSQITLMGHPIAQAEGPVLVGMAQGGSLLLGPNAAAEGREKQGVIWGGGKSRTDLPLTLLTDSNHRYGLASQQLAMRINEVFQEGGRTGPTSAVAAAQQNQGVMLRVPPQYRLNIPRYLRVVRLIPFQAQPPRKPVTPPGGADPTATASADKAPEPAPKPDPLGRSYRQHLADDLLDPSRTVSAALRLEALGPTSIPVLQEGLKSKDSLVRFCSAEALAYLGSPSAGEELAQAVLQQPLFRAFGLTALASLDESVSQLKLQELLNNGEEPEIRYGAFRALRALDETNPVVHGVQLNDTFWVHEVARNSTPLVHVSTARRAEIVLFGPEPMLLPPFSLQSGDFVITATAEDDRCTVSRVPPHGGETERRQCPLRLTALLKTMADLGAQYAEVADVLKEANLYERLTSKVRFDALPQAVTVFDLADAGKSGVGLNGSAGQAVPDLGATPTLYEKPRAPRASPWGEDGAGPVNTPASPEVRGPQQMTAGDE